MSQVCTPLFMVLGNFMFGGIRSKSERDVYHLVSSSFVAYVIENSPTSVVKVTPMYTYDPVTSTCLPESIKLHLV